VVGDDHRPLFFEFLTQMLIGLAGTLVFAAVLFLSAGRLDYWQGWLYAATSAIMTVGMHAVLRRHPDLETERRRPGGSAESWDKAFLALGLLLTLATLVVAGLDSGRGHWAPRLHWSSSAVGVALSLAGTILFLLALRENRFFSAVVRLQADRGQTVCSTGPYRWIRHPGNAGMIVGTVGVPLLLTSAWAVIPCACSVILLVVRTRLEDAFLEERLEGYRGYQRTTRFRLLPRVW
jgi:protein-S-isoprenylcysteine O-methyltransferase Ste14